MQFMELMATLGLDASNYNQGLDAAQSRVSAVGGAIMRGVGVIGAASAAAVGAAATGVVNLTSQAVNSYAEYEQLVGGAELMFGDAYDFIADKAQNAYATVQMSQNDYLAQVNGFATGLTTALGGNAQAAAELADRIVNAEADVVAATGNSQEAVQNAFNGIMRSNYTMLDSLQIGIAPTQAGMQEVIDKVNEWHAAQGELTNYTMDSIADQQAALVDYIEMIGMAGYAQNEASQTIQGSLATLQGAWQNLLTGLGNADADLGSLIDSVVESALTLVNNITPIAEQAMNGIAQLIDGLAPVLADELPVLIETVLPSLLTAVTTIITSVANALPEIASVLLPQIPPIIQRVIPVIMGLIPSLIFIGGEVIGAVITGMVENAPAIVQAGLDALQQLINAFSEGVNGDGLSQLADVTMQIIEMIGTFLVENIPVLMSTTAELISQLVTYFTAPENQAMILDVGLSIIEAIADGLVQAMPTIISLIPTLIGNNILALEQEFPRVLQSIGTLLTDLSLMVLGLVGGLMGQTYDEVIGNLTAVWDGVGSFFGNMIGNVTSFVGDVSNFISGMWVDIASFFVNGIVNVGDALSGWWDEIVTFFSNLADNALTWAGDMIDNFVDGLMGGISRVGDAVSGIADEVRSFLGFSEPERGPLSNFHTFAPDMIDLWNQTLEDSMSSMDTPLTNVSNHIADGISTPMNAGGYTGGAADSRPIVIPVYIGNEKIDEIIVDSNQRMAFISGGRA